MVGGMHNDFVFVVRYVMRERRNSFLIDLLAIFWRKGATTLNFENYCEVAFLHDWIELEGWIWRSTLSSISLVYWPALLKILMDIVSHVI
jgi:hypothetical protein